MRTLYTSQCVRESHIQTKPNIAFTRAQPMFRTTHSGSARDPHHCAALPLARATPLLPGPPSKRAATHTNTSLVPPLTHPTNTSPVPTLRCRCTCTLRSKSLQTVTLSPIIFRLPSPALVASPQSRSLLPAPPPRLARYLRPSRPHRRRQAAPPERAAAAGRRSTACPPP